MNLEVFHIAFGFKVLTIGIHLAIHDHAREGEAGAFIQLGIQWQQLHMSNHRAVIIQGCPAVERRLVFGGREPFLYRRRFLQHIAATRHHR